MFKNIKVKTKILLGFSLVLLIAIIIGTIAVVNMNKVKNDMKLLTDVRLIQMEHSVALEEYVSAGMYAMRGYNFTYNKADLVEGKKQFDLAIKELNFLKDLAKNQTKNVPKLIEKLPNIEKYLNEYISGIDETEHVVNAKEKLGLNLTQTEEIYLKTISEFIKMHSNELRIDLQNRSRIESIEEKRYKMELSQNILEIGSYILQALHDAKFEENSSIYKKEIYRFNDLDKIFDKFNNILKRDDEIKKLNSLKDIVAKYKEVSIAYFNEEENLIEINKGRIISGTNLLNEARVIVGISAERMQGDAINASSSLNQAISIVSIGLIIAVIIGIIISLIISGAIVKAIQNINAATFELEKGDLSIRMDNSSKDEIGEMSTNLNDFLEKLGGIITNIKDYSTRTASGTEELSVTMDQINDSIEDLRSTSTTTAAAIEEMSSTTSNINENVSDLLKNSEETLELAHNGGNAVRVTIDGINRIKSVVEKGRDEVQSLGDKTDEIGEIVTVINDIAAQTNLLALNAAIEAARAGEAGKGFEVVAEEVRKLAEKTAEATKEIGDMIKNIQRETNGVVIKMEEVNEEVDEGVKTAHNTGLALEEIVNQTQNLRDMVNMISSATREQSVTADELAKQTERITRSVDQNGQAIEQSGEAIREIADIAERLNQIVAQFKLDNGYNNSSKGMRNI